VRGVEQDTSGARRAWGWVAALRAGATTPWTEWHDRDASPEPTSAEAAVLPGAQQLELLRRLNEVRAGGADAAAPLPAGLADRVLAADLPGRGRADLALAGAGEPPRFGPPPVDPARLAEEELLRPAVGLLADDLAAAAPLPAARHPRRRPWAPSYRLAGDDWLAAPLRSALRARARPEQHHPDRVYVLGSSLAAMVAHAWTTRAFAESGAAWRPWIGGFVAHDRLPPRADLVAAARHWAGRVGPDRVVVVLDVGRLPGRLRGWHAPAGPPPVTAVGVDLVRRTSTTLAVMVPPDQRTALLRTLLLPRLPVDPAATIALPAAHRDWIRRHAETQRAALLDDGYPVLGSPDRLLEPGTAGVTDAAPADVLGLALRLLLDPVEPTAKETR
jgi:hypothetical protein